MPVGRRVPVRPGPATPRRRTPAVLLVILAALASLLGATAVAADAQIVARSTVGGARAVAGHAAVAVRDRGAPSTLQRFADRVSASRSEPAPSPVVPGALALLFLAVLWWVGPAAAGWSLPGRTPGGHRGRAPPAYPLA